MAEKARRFWHDAVRQVLSMIDSRTVRLFQLIMYTWFAAAGVYAAFFSAPADVVEIAMGGIVYDAWVWMNILCPAVVAIGCWLPRFRVESEPTPRGANGLILQICGDLGMTFTLAAYVGSVCVASWWGKGTYALFLAGGLTLCAALLVVGDVRRIVKSDWQGPRS